VLCTYITNETNGPISTASQAVEFSLDMTARLEFTTALRKNLVTFCRTLHFATRPYCFELLKLFF